MKCWHVLLLQPLQLGEVTLIFRLSIFINVCKQVFLSIFQSSFGGTKFIDIKSSFNFQLNIFFLICRLDCANFMITQMDKTAAICLC